MILLLIELIFFGFLALVVLGFLIGIVSALFPSTPYYYDEKNDNDW